jgi:hypothetical protein
MRHIRSEANRMSELVDDLLLLPASTANARWPGPPST